MFTFGCIFYPQNLFIKKKKKIEIEYLEYLDKNNLYGCAMSGFLPCGGFQWLKIVDNFDVNSISENSSIGYILKVDLEYPDELHY